MVGLLFEFGWLLITSLCYVVSVLVLLLIDFVSKSERDEPFVDAFLEAKAKENEAATKNKQVLILNDSLSRTTCNENDVFGCLRREAEHRDLL